MLNVISLDDAVNIARGISSVYETELIPITHAVGRTAAHDTVSKECIPSFDRSTVDGFALSARNTFGASEALPCVLGIEGEILMGENEKRTLSDDGCMIIPTGGRLPENANAVVMLEYTDTPGDGCCYIEKSCAPLENVTRSGDDIKAGQILIKGGTVIGAKHIAALAAVGYVQTEVLKKPKIGIISTGDELIEPELIPQGSQIRNINSYMLCACADNDGCDTIMYPIVPDNAELLEQTVIKALDECDFLLISGGSSVGERDALYDVLSRLGKICFHGISVKPGKPTMLAQIGSKPVFGLPGHPLAAFFMYRLLVRPLILMPAGGSGCDISAAARSAVNIPSNHGREELLPVVLKEGVFTPLYGKSGVVSVLSRADGYIRIGRNREGVEAGATMPVYLF